MLLQEIADHYEDAAAEEQTISYLLRCILIAQDSGQLAALEAHVGQLVDTWLEMPCGEAGG